MLSIGTIAVMKRYYFFLLSFFFQAEDGIRDSPVTGVQTCALPILGLQTIQFPSDLQCVAVPGKGDGPWHTHRQPTHLPQPHRNAPALDRKSVV